MRSFLAFIPALALMAQSHSTQPKFKPAILMHKVDPQYTPEARAAGLQGTLTLYVEVDAIGKPSDIEVMEGLGMGLDEAAINAVRQWQYRPNPDAADLFQDGFELELPFRLDTPDSWFVAGQHYKFSTADLERYGDMPQPAAIHYVAPDAAACREPGATVVRLTVGKDGTPRDVHLAPAGGAAGDAVVKAVQSWKFNRAHGKEKAVEAQGYVEFACRPAGDAEKMPPIQAPADPIAGSMSAPVLVKKVAPEYTEQARRARVQGTSMLYVRITPAGKATEIHILRRLGMGLDQKAIEAVKLWEFHPGMKGGHPVTVEATIEVNFKLL
jgi:TonB family protein